MEYVYRETEYVTGVHQVHGGSGDPRRSPPRHPAGPDGRCSAPTAATREVGKVQRTRCRGLGHVGMEFVKLLRERGAKVFVTDINQQGGQGGERARRQRWRGLDDIYDVAADVYSPCALGGTVNEATLPRLKAKVIRGAANNQLANNAIGDEVEKRGIVYAPTTR